MTNSFDPNHPTSFNSTLPSLSYPIVGKGWRPPAAAVLSLLPTDHPLIVEREPTNIYDANAIRVVVTVESLLPLYEENQIEWDNILSNFGKDWSDVQAQFPLLHLGYVPAVFAKDIAPEMDRSGSTQMRGLYSVSIKGRDTVTFNDPQFLPDWCEEESSESEEDEDGDEDEN